MKVLFVCPFVPWPLVDGGKIRTFNLIRSAARHAEIHLRILREPNTASDAEDALRPWCKSLSFLDRSRPGRLKRWTLPKLERWFHSEALYRCVESDLERGDFHVVHLDELLLARIVPARYQTPVIQHHHKLDTVLYDSLTTNEGPQRHFDLWKLRRLERESTRRYRHHLLCSQEDAEFLRERYGALDVAVVPSGFDPEAFSRKDPPTARNMKRLVFLGSMDYGPNVDGIRWFCSEIFPHLEKLHPGLELDVVGRDPSAEVRALASDRIRVTGRVAEVGPYLESAALLVCPLRIGGGTRLKIVESLAIETPVVSTRIGAEGLGLIDKRHLLMAENAPGFVHAVDRLLADPERAAELAAAGHAYVSRRYRWEALANDLLDYWERIAFSGKASPSR